MDFISSYMKNIFFRSGIGSSQAGAAETNPTRNHEIAALLGGFRIQHCCELWCRLQMQLESGIAVAVCRLAAVAPNRPLAWEPPYAAGAVLKSKKKKKKKKKKKRNCAELQGHTSIFTRYY